jgi:hypothetical protein
MNITRKEARKRLMMIERKTRRVPPERFDFNRWVGNDWGGKWDLSCGTVACSIGFSTTIPYLRKLGLRLFRNLYGSYIPTALTPDTNGVYSYTVSEHEQSVCQLLGITNREYNWLFVPSAVSGADNLPTTATNIEVADRLAHFIDWRFPEFAKHPAWPVKRSK